MDLNLSQEALRLLPRFVLAGGKRLNRLDSPGNSVLSLENLARSAFADQTDDLVGANHLPDREPAWAPLRSGNARFTEYGLGFHSRESGIANP